MNQMKDRENLDAKYLGGPFDRQVRIEDWNQDLVKKQTVLILGVGGLGSVVITSLARLGVGKILMVDYDVVDLHNLNRQLLFSHADVGKPKVQAALANVQFHKAADTEIQIFHGNALANWEVIVSFVKKSTFVYNCIDWGDKFDAAVSSLCLKVGVPLVMGGTFSTSMTIDFFPANGKPCYLCTETVKTPPQGWEKVKPDLIMELKDILFLPKNNNPIGRSSVVVCTICGELMVAHFLNWLFLSQEKPYKASRLIFYHNTFEIVKFQLERFMKCPFCCTPEEILEQQKKQQEEAKKKEEQQAKKKEQQAKKKEEQQKQKQTEQEVTSEKKQEQISVKTEQQNPSVQVSYPLESEKPQKQQIAKIDVAIQNQVEKSSSEIK